MMNILFIGGAGFIGSNLVRRFLSNGIDCQIHVVEPDNANVSRLDGLDVKLHCVNLKDFDRIKDIVVDHEIDTVVHLVSTLIPGSTYEDYLEEFKNVIFPSIELMELCAKNEVKFVYFSSGGTIYGNRFEPVPFSEQDAMAPISYYGWSKQMMENGIQFKHRTQQLKYLIVRPSNPYGLGQNLYGKQGLVAVSIGKMLRGEPVEVWGDGSATRDYIFIDDLAEAVTQLLVNDVSNTAVNIGSGVGYSVNDVLAFLKIASGVDFKIVYKDPRPVDVSSMILDTSHLKEFVDMKFTPLMEGIKKFYHDVKGGEAWRE